MRKIGPGTPDNLLTNTNINTNCRIWVLLREKQQNGGRLQNLSPTELIKSVSAPRTVNAKEEHLIGWNLDQSA